MDLKKAEHQRKILVVDDNPDIHRDFEMTLRPEESTEHLDQLKTEIFGSSKLSNRPPHEYLLSFALQGKQALELVKDALAADDPFHLAFIDMRMPPGWNGLETIHRIWQSDPDIQIVLCTAYSDYSYEEIEHRLQHTDNLLIIKKPFDVSELAQMANSLTRKWILLKTSKVKLDELEKLVDKRTKAWQQASSRLEEEFQKRRRLERRLNGTRKTETAGALAIRAVHDLNNLLSGLVKRLDLLQKQAAAQCRTAEQHQLVQTAGNKATAIAQGMFTLGRQAVIGQPEVDLTKVVDDYLQSPQWFQTQSLYPYIHIRTRIESGSFCLKAAETLLTSTLDNLVLNAAEAMPAGGTITIGLDRRKLEKTLSGYESIRAGDYLVLSVSDTGKGIADDDLEHIFESFYTKGKTERNGTGLALVWSTVRSHNGYIDLKSSERTGTQFELYFPDEVCPV